MATRRRDRAKGRGSKGYLGCIMGATTTLLAVQDSPRKEKKKFRKKRGKEMEAGRE